MGRFSCTLFAARCFSLVFVRMKHQSIVLANGEKRLANSVLHKKTPPAGVGGAFGKILSSHSIISDATSSEA